MTHDKIFNVGHETACFMTFTRVLKTIQFKYENGLFGNCFLEWFFVFKNKKKKGKTC